MALTKEQAWYYRHMGYSYPSGADARGRRRARERQAREAARAVAHARAAGWVWAWEDDAAGFEPDGCDGGAPHCGWCPPDAAPPCPGHVCEGCMLRDAGGRVLASLWGIVDADGDYRRVVEAELAGEAYHAEVERPAERSCGRLTEVTPMKNDKATPPARETWRVGDAGLTVFGPPNGNPSPRTVARCLRRGDATSIVRDHNAVGVMREALRAMVGAMDRRGDEGEEFSESELDAYRKARAALARAGGE